MTVKPQREHQWLQQLVGEWSFESECIMGPGQPPAKHSGSETVRTLGEVWVVCEGRAELSGGGASLAIMTLGFDPTQKRFVGTFIASMMTHLWIYNGSLDAAEKVLTLDCEGPSFTTEGKMAKYQDILEILGPDHRTLSSRSLGEDGQWRHFMTAHYRRKK